MSIFLDKSKKPNDKLLAEALGITYPYWKELESALEKLYGPLAEDWKYYGKSSGWTLKLLLKKRNLFFFAPYHKFFRIAFVFGDKSVNAIEESDLPPSMVRELVEAKRYVEGRGLRIDVKKRSTIGDIVKLVGFKLQS
jgi:Protein of unknown function (DUF3788)